MTTDVCHRGWSLPDVRAREGQVHRLAGAGGVVDGEDDLQRFACLRAGDGGRAVIADSRDEILNLERVEAGEPGGTLCGALPDGLILRLAGHGPDVVDALFPFRKLPDARGRAVTAVHRDAET